MIEKNSGTPSLHELYAKLANSVDAVIDGKMDVRTANVVVGLCATATKVASLLLSYQRSKSAGQLEHIIPALEARSALPCAHPTDDAEDKAVEKRPSIIESVNFPKDMGLRDFGVR